jgi:predicted nucleic acid-binding Zn ribbon protein
MSDDPKRCENGCGAPIRSYEDFCSEGCWEEWHAKHDPETLARATPR